MKIRARLRLYRIPLLSVGLVMTGMAAKADDLANLALAVAVDELDESHDLVSASPASMKGRLM